MLYPTGAGEPRRLESGAIKNHASAAWFPDGKRILVCGTDEKRTSRCYVQEIGGAPKTRTRASGISRARRARIFAAMASPPFEWSRSLFKPRDRDRKSVV